MSNITYVWTRRIDKSLYCEVRTVWRVTDEGIVESLYEEGISLDNPRPPRWGWAIESQPLHVRKAWIKAAARGVFDEADFRKVAGIDGEQPKGGR